MNANIMLFVAVLFHLIGGRVVSALIYRMRFGKSIAVKNPDPTHDAITRRLGSYYLLWIASIAIGLFSESAKTFFVFQPVVKIENTFFWVSICLSATLMLATQAEMGRAFRIGQAKSSSNEQSELKNDGFHRFSRNPIYLFSFMYMSVATFAAANPLAIAFLAGIAFEMHQLVLSEEAFLNSKFGDSYRAYAGHTPRYLGLPKRAQR